MTYAARALEYVQLAVFLAVAAVAGARWVQRRGATRAWLAATFGLLGVVVLAGQVLPETPVTTADEVAQEALVCVLLLFPYFLYRFMASFERPPRWLEIAAGAAVATAVVATIALPPLPGPEEPRTPLVNAYVLLVLAEWVFLSGAVIVRFWRASHAQPTVARRRLRLLSSGAAALAFALVIAGAAPSGGEVSALSVFVEAIAILSALLFLGGFAPPRALLRSWRARDIEAIQGSFVAMAGATSPAEVVDELLPRVVRLVGAEGAAIYRGDGVLLGRIGVTRDAADEAGKRLVEGVTEHGAGHLRLHVTGGLLDLFTSAYTPYFGREELELLRNVAALVHVTLERTYAHAREVAMREALDDAQRIAHLGSWRADLATGAVDASDEMYRLYGLEPQSEPLTRARLRELVHPDDAKTSVVEEAVASGAEFTSQFRIMLPDGAIRWVAARGAPISDADGNVVAVLGTLQDVTEARRLDKMRSEFVANAAHELRTPLTTVSAMATLLAAQRDRLSPAELDNAFAALGRQGERARALVSSLLDLSRLDAGRIPVQLGPVDVAQVVARALETAPPPESASVAVDVPPGTCAVADPERLQDIVVNLLSNAYRYGGPGVVVSARNGGDSVRLAVADDGRGVPEDFVAQLFQPFSRAASVTGTPGSGLGLAISHRLAAAIGGDLAYERAGGSRFTVTLRAAS